MSISALALPDYLPEIENGKAVKTLFGGAALTDAGARLREAFRDLVPIWPEP